MNCCMPALASELRGGRRCAACDSRRGAAERGVLLTSAEVQEMSFETPRDKKLFIFLGCNVVLHAIGLVVGTVSLLAQ